MIGAGIVRAIARPTILSFVQQGLRPQQITRNLVSMGISYRRITMLNDIREFTHFHKQKGWTQRMDPEKLIPLDRIPRIDMKAPYNFRGYLNVVTRDRMTGEDTTTIKSFYSDDHLDEDQWVDEWLQGQVEDPSDPTVEIMSATLTDVIKNARLFR